jgi:glutamine synthetase
MDKQQIISYLKEKGIDKIKFAFADIDGVLRGKVIHHKKFTDGLETGYGFCDVVFGWDSSDVCNKNIKLTGCIQVTPISHAVLICQLSAQFRGRITFHFS